MVSAQYIAASTDYKLTIKGAMSHTISLGADIYGNITRMDNVVDGLTKELEAYLSDYKEAGCPIVSHSEQYRRTYLPSYRVIKGALL